MSSIIIEREDPLVIWMSNIGTLLSLVGEAWIFYIFLKTWKLWTYSGKMILCLTLSYLFYTIANFLANFDERAHNSLCQIDGFLRNFGTLASFFWAWKVSKSAYSALADSDYTSRRHNEFFLLFKGFLYPAIFAFPPLISSLFGFKSFVYGYKSYGCGANSESENVSFIIFILYSVAPASFLLISTMFYSIKILKFVKFLPGGLKISPMRFLIYPIALFIIWTPTLIHSCLVHFGKYFLWLDALRVFSTHSIGFLHSVIYGIQTKVLTKIEEEKEELVTEIGLLEGSMYDSFETDTLSKSMSHYVM